MLNVKRVEMNELKIMYQMGPQQFVCPNVSNKTVKYDCGILVNLSYLCLVLKRNQVEVNQEYFGHSIE